MNIYKLINMENNIDIEEIALMTKYCLKEQIRFTHLYEPADYIYKGSKLVQEFSVILQGGNKGKLEIMVNSIKNIEDAITFYNQ